jgi:osmoprotectant transport system ATP-binding protein
MRPGGTKLARGFSIPTEELATSNPSHITFRDVSFTRAGGRLILDRIGLDVAEGEVLALIGRSGSGKTTLLKMINGLLVPSAGTVLVQGRDTREWDPITLRRQAGFVLQEIGLFPHMTIGENVGIVPRLAGWPPDRIARRVGELLDLVGLPAPVFAGRWPDELSGGQRQRAGVARALAVDPPILLMDEPFGALDPMTRVEMQAEFQRIQSALGKTVVMVTHDMHEALALGDRLAVIEAGRLVACDTPERVAGSTDPTVRALLDARRGVGSPGGSRESPPPPDPRGESRPQGGGRVRL